MKLIVGLGNPDKQYQNTRHNLGQNIVKEYVETFCKTSLHIKQNLSAQIFEIGQGSDKTIFAIPTEYMNNSGITVQKISQFYKISPLNIYIIHDDLDLEVGDYKIQFDRGPAGHNGIKSIIENLGTQQFNRIRIGIGKSQNNIPVEDYVLQPFSSQEKDIINILTPEIFEEIKNILGP
ncbi:MAG: aminoacyl-tRNA hydrolase [Candidatus Shapirobacteria bacterium]|nr:aminoacyl-tRNA hydrolase [Candidatus Shapirobacteria bacterium]MDD3002304.1 aminoacyl-tRNA hydrolase [Candidatus Shapirobacteria bacterium]MDD4382691.1 aminoacyl-tRNA hydrolase [Candidatus Shapirobacteria bacterium]